MKKQRAYLLDSSAWISLFADETTATTFEKYAGQANLIVPTIVLYEVYRQLIKKMDAREAMIGVSQMSKGMVRDLDQATALLASELSLQYKLATADSIVYATTLSWNAQLITLDNDFRGLPHCKVL